MSRTFSTVVVVALVIHIGLPPSPAAPKKTKVDGAVASFRINPTGCRETRVLVVVSQTRAGTQLDLIYDVQSTCQDPGDFLYYHSITGSEQIRKQDFKVQADGKKAVLNTVIPVFDDEGGVEFDMGISVTWKATGPAVDGTRPATASLTILYPFQSQYITDEIPASVAASITRAK